MRVDTTIAMAVRAQTPAPVLPHWLRIAAVPPAVAVVLVGIWVAGGVLTNDFRVSMALTALWFALVLVGAAVAWRRLPALRPAALAAVTAFVVVGGYLGYASTTDRVVDETVVTGPAALDGSFRSLAHETSGTARVIERPDGTRVLTLTGFRTDPGPDLYLYALPGRVPGDDVDGGTSLGRLKGNVGDQQYALPAALELDRGATIVIWCRAFSVGFGAATLASV